MATQSTYKYQSHPATKDAPWVKWILIALAVGFMAIMLVVPLVAVFYEALKEGWGAYVSALTDPDALHAIKLTLITTAIVLPINTIIGVALAYLITRHKFRGKFIITTLLDLPFAVSPVVAGLMFVLLFGANTLIGGFFESLGIKIIFATTGIVLATLFVTFPFIAREIIPLMQSIGDSEESKPNAWGKWLANVLARYPTQHQMGVALWHYPDQRSCDGRVWGGVSRLWAYPWRDQHHATDD